MTEKERRFVLFAFLRAVGVGLDDLQLAHNVAYVAVATGFPLPYRFGWWNGAWPESPELTRDFDALGAYAEALDGFALPKLSDDLVAHVKTRVLPLIANASWVGNGKGGINPAPLPLAAWTRALAKVHYLVAQNANSPDEAVDVVAGEFAKEARWPPAHYEAALNQAVQTLAAHGLLKSELVQINRPDPAKQRPR